MKSVSRIAPVHPAAHARSSLSPAEWPSVSFTAFRPSMSSIATVSGSRALRARRASTISRSSQPRRLAIPVSLSWVAISWRLFSAYLRSVMSRAAA